MRADLLTLTYCQTAASMSEKLSKGSLKLPIDSQKGELTFASRGYKIREQPAQWTPQMMRVGVPLNNITLTVRDIEI